MITNSWRRRYAGAAAMTLLTAGAAIALAAPGSASVPGAPPPGAAILPGYEVVDHESSRTTSSKSDTAQCPGTKVVIGAGVTSSNGFNDIRYDDLIPREDEVYAFAFEDSSGNPNDWTLKPRAICADEPFGYEIVSATSSPRNSDPDNTVTASCPGGKELLGTGWEISGGNGQVGVTRVVPTAGDDVTVTATEDDTGWGGTWEVTAYAICAAGIQGQSIQSDYKGYHSATHGGSVTCPAGKVSLGAGFTAENHPEYTVLQSLLPGGQYQGEEMLNATVGENDTGTASSWGMYMHVICADA